MTPATEHYVASCSTCSSFPPQRPVRQWRTVPWRPGSGSWWRPLSSPRRADHQLQLADGWDSPWTHIEQRELISSCLGCKDSVVSTWAFWWSALPSGRRSRCTSASCCGTGRGRGRGQSQTGRRRWWAAAGRWVWLPVHHTNIGRSITQPIKPFYPGTHPLILMQHGKSATAVTAVWKWDAYQSLKMKLKKHFPAQEFPHTHI